MRVAGALLFAAAFIMPLAELLAPVTLLPIPALDGGRVLILLIERITRRKINEKLVENIILASFVLLIGIFLFATYNDIAKMF